MKNDPTDMKQVHGGASKAIYAYPIEHAEIIEEGIRFPDRHIPMASTDGTIGILASKLHPIQDVLQWPLEKLAVERNP